MGRRSANLIQRARQREYPGARAESEHRKSNRENRETLGKVAGLNNTRQGVRESPGFM